MVFHVSLAVSAQDPDISAQNPMYRLRPKPGCQFVQQNILLNCNTTYVLMTDCTAVYALAMIIILTKVCVSPKCVTASRSPTPNPPPFPTYSPHPPHPRSPPPFRTLLHFFFIFLLLLCIDSFLEQYPVDIYVICQ